MERTELEKSLAALAKGDDFRTVEIAYSVSKSGNEYFSARLYWVDPKSRFGGNCVSEDAGSFAEAITLARIKAAYARTPLKSQNNLPEGEG